MTLDDRSRWERLKHKVTVTYDASQDKQWLSRKLSDQLKEFMQPENCHRDHIDLLVSKPEGEQIIQEHVRAGSARNNFEFPTLPDYLPYAPIPSSAFAAPYTSCQSEVKDMRVFLSTPPYNWPQSIGDNVNDWADISQAELQSIFNYKHVRLPPAMLKRIHIMGSYNSNTYDPASTVSETSGFFSDNAGNPLSLHWRLEYIGASNILYTNPAYPNTYPSNRLLYWNNTVGLTAQSTRFYRSSQLNQWGTTTQLSPPEENVFNWVVDLPKGVHLKTNDNIRLTTGYPCIVDKAQQFNKLYVCCDLEIIDFDFNYNEIRLVMTILITMQNEQQEENTTKNATKNMKLIKN